MTAQHARSLELNVFPLPRRFLDAVLAQPGVLLQLSDVLGSATGSRRESTEHAA